jgi:hypothetical protein
MKGPPEIPVMRPSIPVNGAKIPCSPGEGISREMPGAQGFLRFCAISRQQIREKSLLISLIEEETKMGVRRKI